MTGVDDRTEVRLTQDVGEIIGVDFARLEDYTAIVVLDPDGRLVAFDRLNQTTWRRIQSKIERLAEKYTPAWLAVDATRDNRVVQDLDGAGLRVDPVNFSAKTEVLIENLATRLEGGELTLSSAANVLVNELEVYEYDVTEAGTVRCSAPSGFHDDCVDALALAVSVVPSLSKVRTRSERSERAVRLF